MCAAQLRFISTYVWHLLCRLSVTVTWWLPHHLSCKRCSKCIELQQHCWQQQLLTSRAPVFGFMLHPCCCLD
jgi:hypothetical protein